MTDDQDWSQQETLLKRRREELTQRIARIEGELEQPVSPDDEDRASEREGEEVLVDLEVAGQRELVAIEAALERIAEGSYGMCVVCDTEIAPARLKAVPTATVCRDCA